MAAKACGHASCSCSVAPDEMFCAEACRRASEAPLAATRGCDCGHVQCLGDAGKKGPQALARGAFEAPGR